MSGLMEWKAIPLDLMLIVQWNSIPVCKKYISLSLDMFTFFYQPKQNKIMNIFGIFSVFGLVLTMCDLVDKTMWCGISFTCPTCT